jgi:hypothetical protein
MAVYNDILNQVQTQLRALDLTGIADANIVIRKRPTQRALPAMPGILICPWGSPTIDRSAGTNERDDIEYPVLIATVNVNAMSQTDNVSRNLGWHEDIRQEFINQRLSGVTSVSACFVDPRDSFDPSAFDNSTDLGWMILRFLSREVRGN